MLPVPQKPMPLLPHAPSLGKPLVWVGPWTLGLGCLARPRGQAHARHIQATVAQFLLPRFLPVWSTIPEPLAPALGHAVPDALGGQARSIGRLLHNHFR